MASTKQRVRRMTRKELDAIQKRAAKRLKSMTWRGWITRHGDEIHHVGHWKHHPFTKPGDKDGLESYAECAPFLWTIEARIECERQVGDKLECYAPDALEALPSQVMTWEEMKVCALDLMADLERQVNSRHIIDRHFVIRPRT